MRFPFFALALGQTLALSSSTGVASSWSSGKVTPSASCSANDAEAAKAIRARLARWVEQANAADRQGMNEVWAPGLVGWFPRHPAFTDSAAAAVAGLESRNAPPSPSRFEIVVDDVAASGDIAAVHDIWTETKTFGSDRRTVRRTIHGSELWRCQPDGRWRIARYVSAPEPWVKL